MAIENKFLTDEQRKKLVALLNLETGLTTFEVEFIERLSHQRGALSAGQWGKLDEVYRERILKQRARR